MIDTLSMPPELLPLFQELRKALELSQGDLVQSQNVLRTTQVCLEESQNRAKLLELTIKKKDDEIKLLCLKLWGPKSEKLSPNQMELLFGEISVSPEEIQQETTQAQSQPEKPVNARKPRTEHAGRNTLPEHLDRRIEVIPCHEQDCNCQKCGQPRPIIGYETREELVCVPAQFHVRVVQREKRGSHCEEEQGVVTAPAPAQIVPKSKLSNEFIVEALATKYQQHVPIFRQLAALANDHGIELSRRTVNSAILSAGGLLQAVVGAQRTELLKLKYLQVDETTVACQVREKTGRNHRAYIWEYGSPGAAVVFDFQMGRGRDGPKTFLKGYKGVIQCDGYAAYDKLGEGIEYAGCMAHVRRGFVESGKLNPKDREPTEIVVKISSLYEIEKQARDKGMDAGQRLELRESKSVVLMEELKKRIVEIRQSIEPGRKLAKACDYALGQWERLEVYLKNGEVEIDNNWCEGAMRPLVLGRKNWLHIGSQEAGPSVAAIVSIVETCRRLDINLRKYLGDVLPRLGDWPSNRVGELTPTAWKASQKA